MPNNTVPAADTGLPNLNRRSALAKFGLGGLAAGASLAATASIAAPQDGVAGRELMRLIEAHAKAKDASKATALRVADSQEFFLQMRPPRQVPLYSKWKANEVSMDDGLEKCKRQVRCHISYASEGTDLDLGRHISFKTRRRLKSVFKAAEKEAFALIDALFAQEDECREASGLNRSQTALELSQTAESDALMALCAYPCANLMEANLRAAHLADVQLRDAHVAALRQSLSKARA